VEDDVGSTGTSARRTAVRVYLISPVRRSPAVVGGVITDAALPRAVLQTRAAWQ